jgi:DNA-3-methyladenine glycosylase
VRRLPRAFYARDTREVARALLGAWIVTPERAARIVETEAYHGIDDAASHAFGGPTPRSAIMYGRPGVAYVYLIYGVWCCLNVVTGPERFPSAVLLRAGAIDGVDAREAAGPGKLCRALGIDRSFNGEDLVAGKSLWIARDGAEVGEVRAGRRIGVEYAGDWAARPWRFWIAGHPSVSRPERERRGGARRHRL